MKSRLDKNAAEMYLAHNKGKSVVAEEGIRTLKYKYMYSILKNTYKLLN